jgi:predicted transcriptional regulator
MRTAISIPDELFARAERLARRLGKSRSEVYREALEEYLVRREPACVTAALDEVAGEFEPERNLWIETTADRALERAEW